MSASGGSAPQADAREEPRHQQHQRAAAERAEQREQRVEPEVQQERAAAAEPVGEPAEQQGADLVDFFHGEGIATGIDVDKLAELRDQVGLAVGHRLGSALSAIPAVPAALR